MSKLICLLTFSSRLAADDAAAFLESHGIKSVIQCVDCGGMYPTMAMTGGVKLMVSEIDFNQAKELINNAKEELIQVGPGIDKEELEKMNLERKTSGLNIYFVLNIVIFLFGLVLFIETTAVLKVVGAIVIVASVVMFMQGIKYLKIRKQLKRNERNGNISLDPRVRGDDKNG